MSLFQGARLYDIFFAFRNAQHGSRNPKWPALVRRALALLVWLMILTHGISVVTLWLQIDASVTDSVPTASAAALGYGSGNSDFAVSLNETLCATIDRESYDGASWASCGVATGGTFDYLSTATGLQAYTNRSLTVRTVWLDDGIAIMTPTALPLVGYQASSLGVRAQCRSVTKQCVRCATHEPDVDSDCLGAPSGVRLDCDAETMYNITVKDGGDHFASVLLSANGSVVNGDADSNPFQYGDVVASDVYQTPGVVFWSLFVGNSGFIRHGAGSPLNVL